MANNDDAPIGQPDAEDPLWDEDYWNTNCPVCRSEIRHGSIRCEECGKRAHLACSAMFRSERFCSNCFMDAARERVRGESDADKLIETLELLRTRKWNPATKAS